MKLSIVGILALVAACTPAQLSAFDAAIAQGTAALVPAENLACEGAALLDPSGSTAVCTAIDATGAAIGATFTVVEDVQAITALVARAAPKVPATAEVLKTAVAARKAAK
jgi:hypothetical protein